MSPASGIRRGASLFASDDPKPSSRNTIPGSPTALVGGESRTSRSTSTTLPALVATALDGRGAMPVRQWALTSTIWSRAEAYESVRSGRGGLAWFTL